MVQHKAKRAPPSRYAYERIPSFSHSVRPWSVTAIVHRYSSERLRDTSPYADRRQSAPTPCGAPRRLLTTSTKSVFVLVKRGMRCCEHRSPVKRVVPSESSLVHAHAVRMPTICGSSCRVPRQPEARLELAGLGRAVKERRERRRRLDGRLDAVCPLGVPQVFRRLHQLLGKRVVRVLAGGDALVLVGVDQPLDRRVRVRRRIREARARGFDDGRDAPLGVVVCVLEGDHRGFDGIRDIIFARVAFAPR